jgi:hypothetical protein
MACLVQSPTRDLFINFVGVKIILKNSASPLCSHDNFLDFWASISSIDFPLMCKRYKRMNQSLYIYIYIYIYIA